MSLFKGYNWPDQIMKWWSHFTENGGPPGGLSAYPVCLQTSGPAKSPGHPGALRLFSQGPALPASCHPQSSPQHPQSCRLLLRFLSQALWSVLPLSPPKQNQNVPPPAPFRCSLLSLPLGEPDLFCPSLSSWTLSHADTEHIILLLPVLIRDCGFLFTDQPPSTWHKVGTFNWMRGYRWVVSEEKWV